MCVITNCLKQRKANIKESESCSVHVSPQKRFRRGLCPMILNTCSNTGSGLLYTIVDTQGCTFGFSDGDISAFSHSITLTQELELVSYSTGQHFK